MKRAKISPQEISAIGQGILKEHSEQLVYRCIHCGVVNELVSWRTPAFRDCGECKAPHAMAWMPRGYDAQQVDHLVYRLHNQCETVRDGDGIFLRGPVSVSQHCTCEHCARYRNRGGATPEPGKGTELRVPAGAGAIRMIGAM